MRLSALAASIPAMMALALIGCSGSSLSSSATASASTPSAQPLTPSQLKDSAVKCLRSRDLACAESSFSDYIKLRPTDSKAIANLGMVLNHEDKDEAAIVQFEKAIAMGEGAYDLFGMYADSLAKVGRVDDAIDWSYKTLKLVPSLVDVRGKLAKLLLIKNRRYEALALLAEFDQYLNAHGQRPYFEAERIAMESVGHVDEPAVPGESDKLRLVKLDSEFFAPVVVGESGTHAFVVDTGASSVVLNDDFLAASKAKYAITRTHVTARVADGKIVSAKEVLIDRLNVGSFELDDVHALVCSTCSLLLGENALTKFDMSSTQIQGVDVLTLTRRKHS
ncbi:MAG: retroviral-like aspartic protease family protein [Rhodanobacter sp.]